MQLHLRPKKLEKTWLLLFIGMNLTLVSCKEIPIRNTEWCGDLGPLGASCFNTLNANTRDIGPREWEEERLGKLCTDAKYFADLSGVIEKLCTKTKKCVYIKDQAEKLEANAFAVEKKAKTPRRMKPIMGRPNK